MNRDPDTFRDTPINKHPFDLEMQRSLGLRGMVDIADANDPEFDARAAAIKAGPGCTAGCILIAALCIALFTGFAISPAGEAAKHRLELALCGDPV